MDTANPRSSYGVSLSAKWSVSAGVYAFLWATAILLRLYFISDTLVKLLGLSISTGNSAFLFAAPVTVIGAVVWWGLVERRQTYSYRLGIAYGLLTVLCTVVFWTLVFSIVWGLTTVAEGWMVVGLLTGISVPIALVIGVTAMYARRRLGDEKERIPE